MAINWYGSCSRFSLLLLFFFFICCLLLLMLILEFVKSQAPYDNQTNGSIFKYIIFCQWCDFVVYTFQKSATSWLISTMFCIFKFENFNGITLDIGDVFLSILFFSVCLFFRVSFKTIFIIALVINASIKET